MNDDLVRYEAPTETAVVVHRREFPEIQNRHTDGWIAVIEPVTQLAEAVADTDFVPRGLQGNAPAVAAAILYGRELDMPPMQALSQVFMVEGRPTVSAEQLRAMVLAAGHEFTFTEFTGGSVTVVGKRKGSKLQPTSVTWTMAMAQAAGLATKKNWQRHPRQMLTARATAELCRLIFADVIHGVRASEEVEDEEQVAEVPGDGKAKVSRARKGAESSAAAGATAGAPPSPASPTPAATRPPRPPLPGAGSKAGTEGSSPGEGRKSSSSTPSEPVAKPEALTTERVAEIHDVPAEMLTPEPANPVTVVTEAEIWSTAAGGGPAFTVTAEHVEGGCPHISNGQYCRYYADHEGPHTYGGGLGDPVSNRHCGKPTEHDSHAWEDEKHTTYNCSGKALGDDTSGRNLVAKWTTELRTRVDAGEFIERHCPDFTNGHAEHIWDDQDGAFVCFGLTIPDTDGGPVEDKAPKLHAGQRRALFAAFKSLGVEDDEERHHASSALLGRKVTTWTDLTEEDGSKMITALTRVHTRDDLEALIQDAAEKWGSDGA